MSLNILGHSLASNREGSQHRLRNDKHSTMVLVLVLLTLQQGPLPCAPVSAAAEPLSLCEGAPSGIAAVSAPAGLGLPRMCTASILLLSGLCTVSCTHSLPYQLQLQQYSERSHDRTEDGNT